MKLTFRAIQKEEDEKYAKYLQETHNRFCSESNLAIENVFTGDGYNSLKNEYMNDQLRIIMSDNHEGDYIAQIGIDSVFTDTTSLSSFIEDGKVMMPYTSYEALYASKMPEGMKAGVKKNQEMTSAVMNEEVEYEFARRMPIVYPREIFAEARKFIEDIHKVTIEEYMSELDMFNAYNFLGAFCYKYANDLFMWLNTEEMRLPPVPIEANLKAKDFVIVL